MILRMPPKGCDMIIHLFVVRFMASTVNTAPGTKPYLGQVTTVFNVHTLCLLVTTLVVRYVVGM